VVRRAERNRQCNRLRKVSQPLIIGEIWLALLGLMVILSGEIIASTEGIRKLWETFNILDWILVFILALPGFDLPVLADRLDKKHRQ
jgi:hypothetical protein